MSPEEKEYQEYLEYMDHLDAQDAAPQEPAPVSAQPPQQPQGGGAAQTALEGFGQTASMGYLPQLQAAAEKPMSKVMDMVTGNNVSDSLPSYVDRRDENIARQDAESDAHPLANFLGKAGGIAATALIPGKLMGEAAQGAGALARAGNAARQAAVTGALYNPGDEKGVVAEDLQPGKRFTNAAIGGVTGGALGLAGAGVSSLANKSRMVDRVKDSAGLSKYVKGEIDNALEGVNQKYIGPRAAEKAALLKGKSVEFNPDRIEETLPNLAKAMGKNVDENGRRALSGPRADRLRQLLDAKAGYATSKPFDVAGVAKGEDAKAAADILRGKIAGLDPGIPKLNGEMKEAINLRDALSRQSRTAPIASIKGSPGTDKGSMIDAIDKLGGSNLEGLSNSITDAKDLLIHPTNLVKPLALPNELRKIAVRGAAGTARAVEGVTPRSSLQAALQALLEKKR